MMERLRYLKDVLGVESWMRSSGTMSEPRVLVILKASWNEDEKSLVQKILIGAGLGSIPTSLGNSSPCLNAVVFDSEQAPGRVVNGVSTTWNLGPLRRLLVGSAAEVQAAKREVWNLLKLLKEELAL